jgi:Arc/MetJ-type ribon-helix-helix transcriptional regulator
MDERIIRSFVDRGIYSSSKDVISAALKALVREQRGKEAVQRQQTFSDDTYRQQLEEESEGSRHASLGHMGRRAKAR